MRAVLVAATAFASACEPGSRIDPLQRPAVAGPPAAVPTAPGRSSQEPRFEVPAPHDAIVAIGRGLRTCVVRASGRVDCWGRESELGRPRPAIRRETVEDIVGVAPDASCLLRRDGVACAETGEPIQDVAAFGTGMSGCFVHRDGSASCRGTRLEGASDVVAVTSTYNVGCVLRRGGEVACAELHHEAPGARLHPVALPRARRFVLATSSGVAHGCLVGDGDGRVRCYRIAVGRGVPRAEAERVLDARLANARELVLLPGSEEPIVHALVDGAVVRSQGGTVTVVPELRDAMQLSAGCAVRAQGSVVCWGSNAGGAGALPTTIGRVRRPATPIAGAADIVALALGATDSWALTGSGTVRRWGESSEGIESPTLMHFPGPVRTVTAIAATGQGAGCVLADGAAVWCRKRDGVIELVHASGIRSIVGQEHGLYALTEDDRIVHTAFDRADSQPATSTLDAPDGVVELVRGPAWPCARTEGARLACYDGLEQRWKVVHEVTDALRIAASGRDGCAVMPGGTLVCWQRALEGSVARRQVPAFTDALDIAVAGDRACAVRTGGKVTCWFVDDPSHTEDVVETGATTVALGLGHRAAYARPGAANVHACAIMRDRTLVCWGSNLRGELGDGSVRSRDVPYGVPL